MYSELRSLKLFRLHHRGLARLKIAVPEILKKWNNIVLLIIPFCSNYSKTGRTKARNVNVFADLGILFGTVIIIIIIIN
jgi:hypothetical protein